MGKLAIDPTRNFLGNDGTPTRSGPEHQQEYEKQRKINKYLNDTLKHLNLTIDILIDQYDPVKIKNTKARNDKYGQLTEREQQDKNDALQIQRKLDEIKNAEKQLKNTHKEMTSLKKKYDKVKDWKYLSNLYK